MEQITNYVKPELIVVAIALYFVGMALKQAQAVKDIAASRLSLAESALQSARSMCLPPAPAVPDRILQWQFLQRLHREY